MFKKILCAVDGSEHALRAARLACELAVKHGGTLTFLTVTKPFKVTDEVRRYMEVEHLAGEPQYVLDRYTEDVVQKAKDAARDSGLSDVKVEVKEGQPARTIVRVAEQGKYDSIVLGSRGLGDIGSLLLGSVAHKVSSLADCTVVTVR